MTFAWSTDDGHAYVKDETVFFVFLGNEQIFRRKKYIAFVYLLKSTSLQKTSDFDFFEPCHESAILVDFCMDSLLIAGLPCVKY